ncbi:MAG: sulfite exporter TauE/SafE family protein [Alphaproteobacteria bacterium]|nr:sulfite exporter TauE/SafE family protein [Alphaproteobacteria bacterium]
MVRLSMVHFSFPVEVKLGLRSAENASSLALRMSGHAPMMLGGELGTLAVGLVMAGVVSGFLSGTLGAGGIVLVPALYQVLAAVGVPQDLRMHLAIGTSLAVIAPVSLLTLSRDKAATDWPTIRRWSPPLLVGAIGGAVLTAMTSGEGLMLVFGAVAVPVAAYLLIAKPGWRFASRPPQGPFGAILPFAVGGASAMMGTDGGTLGLPALNLLGVERTLGTASAIGALIAIPGAIASVVAGWHAEGLPEYSWGYVNLMAFAVTAPVAFFMAPLGASFAHLIDRARLRKLLGLLIAITALKMLWDALS